MAKYFLFDTETTGNQEKDRIIQVGGILVHGKKELVVFDELCSCDIPISIEAMAVHHITPEMIREKPKFTETDFYKNLLNFNQKENFIIAHNIKFDMEMLNKERFSNNYTKIDTLRCAKHLFPAENSHALQYLRYSLGLYKDEKLESKNLNITIKAHDAIGDVLVMKLLLSRLIEKVRLTGISTNPIEELAKLSVTPVLIESFKFGKYKGEKIANIANSDARYLGWMKSNMELDEDMVYTLNYYNIN